LSSEDEDVEELRREFEEEERKYRKHPLVPISNYSGAYSDPDPYARVSSVPTREWLEERNLKLVVTKNGWKLVPTNPSNTGRVKPRVPFRPLPLTEGSPSIHNGEPCEPTMDFEPHKPERKKKVT
jgi:hypothetical protein